YGVEPNDAMRLAGEQYLADYPNFHSINGQAEATKLNNEAVDWVTAGTAFHWFNPEKSKLEFKRILKAPGFVLLTWNVRKKQDSALLQDYENLILTYSKQYQDSPAQKFNQTAAEKFFKPYSMQEAAFPNRQQFNWQGFKGRLLSTSYSLRANDPQYEKMLSELHKIFERHQQQGLVEFLYETKLYYGQLK
ncbi:MAG: class I SAM-dependent methyltransferase, partial [Proteobacteria bacterium]|nr:class I SAM-dependent methyltransferase [Pseudomonadota bacterium]